MVGAKIIMDEQELMLTEDLDRRAFYGSLITAVFMVIITIIRFAFSETIAADRLQTISLSTLIIIPFISAILARIGKARLGIWLFIAASYLICFVAVFLLYQRLAVPVAILALLVAAGLASFTLKQQDINYTIIATFIGSLLLVLVDALSPIERPIYPDGNILGVIGAIAVLLYGYFIYRQFRHYTLQVKLTIMIIGVTTLSAIAIGVTITAVVEQSLEEQATASLQLQAEKLSDFMGSIFLQKIKGLN